MPHDTIFALSSGALPAAIAVVRLSGPRAHECLAGLAGTLPPPRVATLRTLTDPADGSTIDRALVIAFTAPASASGEDCVEFHLHGSVAVVTALFAALGRWPGVRQARAGEFTRRAFDNGRLDLGQVEGLADLIAAETEAQRRDALHRSRGALRDAVDRWSATVLDLLAEAEAELDFSDAEDDVLTRLDPHVTARLNALIEEIGVELIRARRSRALHTGLKIVVSGPPNVGKSSLVNALVRRNVSIVAPVAGTTRDAVEARLDLGGTVVTIVDTAGLRDTSEPVEAAGVAIAREQIDSADLVLALYCDGAPSTTGVAVRSKSDLGGAGDGLAVSALTGAGIGTLEAWLADWAVAAARPAEPGVLSHRRHIDHCSAAHDELLAAGTELDEVLRAEHLRTARRELGSIVTEASSTEVLDAIFARFCIGK